MSIASSAALFRYVFKNEHEQVTLIPSWVGIAFAIALAAWLMAFPMRKIIN